MGNSKNKKVPKKRTKTSETCNTSSDQKENVPKTEKTRNKPSPDDGIEMSKQLLLKKKTLRTQRRSSSKPERVCPNGKPIPSLSELEKMFEESDEDDEIPKSQPTTSTPEKRMPTTSGKNLLSPTTINKISKRLLGSIQQQKLPDPSEVLEATSLLREKTPPPPPIIPPKKKKKTEIPYIVGCKDRPQIIRKPNTNFCKGDDDYGVEASSDDPEEQTPAKRAKKSKIPKYSKSIFNAHTDEIAERLTQYDAGDLSDASSDSNKTIKYEPTLVQNPRPQSFCPIPSTSRDKETFERNDELFNDSLQETQRTQEMLKKSDENTDESLKEMNTTKDLTFTEKHSTEICNTSTPNKQDDIISNEKTPLTLDDSVRDVTIFKGTDEVEIIDIPYDTIDIDNMYEKKEGKKKANYTIDDSVIEVFDTTGIEVIKSEKQPEIIQITNDEDCMIVPSSDTVNNHNNFNQNEPIVIDDEYSSINMDFDSYNNEPIEIIDVDDVIAENKTILDKWKNSQDLTKINTVVDVPITYKNVTAVQPTVTSSSTEQTTLTHSSSVQTSVTPSTLPQASLAPSSSLQASVAPSSSMQASVAPSNTPQASITPSRTLQANVSQSTGLPTISAANPAITNRNYATNSQSNRRQRSTVNTGLGRALQTILGEFFADLRASRPQSNTYHIENNSGTFTRTVLNSLPSSNTTSSQNAVNMQCQVVDLNRPSSISETTSTIMPPVTPASPMPQRNLGDCPICLDPISSNKGIASTICGHVFCLTCIQASIRSSGKKCPTCRKALKGVGFHQLYL